MSNNTSDPTRTASQVEMAESGEGMLTDDLDNEACADIDIEISVTELERIGGVFSLLISSLSLTLSCMRRPSHSSSTEIER